MKNIFWGACLLLLLMFSIAQISNASEAEKVSVLGVTAISESHPEGEKFIALAIEYSEEFQAGTATIASFMVRDRVVTRVYVNNSGQVDDAQFRGRFMMVELALSNAPGSIVGNTIIHGKFDLENNVYERFPVAWTNALAPSAPFIFQGGDLRAISGKVAPARSLTINKETNPLLETFLALSFEDPTSGITIPYRLYVPKGYEKHDGVLANLPLVVFLHGSGSRGINNLSQLNSNPSALEFVRPEAQTKHPCFVLAPQNPKTLEGWANNVGTNENQKWVITPQLEAIKTIIDNLIKSYNIDTARIYGTGLSQGSKGIMRLSIDYPELYAAQLNSAGYDVYTDEEIAKIRNKPTWQLIAVDDTVNSSKNTRRVMEQFDKAGVTVVRMVDDKGWNGFLRGHGAEVRAQEQWDAAKAANAHVLYTEYLPATIEPSRHWSWQATYANAVIREWLFSQVNPTPYSTK